MPIFEVYATCVGTKKCFVKASSHDEAVQIAATEFMEWETCDVNDPDNTSEYFAEIYDEDDNA